MQFIEIKIVDKRFIMMGNGDPIKQMAERSAALREIEEQAKKREMSGAYVYGDVHNPFPNWLVDCIEQAVSEYKTPKEKIVSKIKHCIRLLRHWIYGARMTSTDTVEYHDENAIYRVAIEGDRSSSERFYSKLEEAIARETHPLAVEWKSKNHIHVTSTPDNEDVAMRDLELYQRGSGPSPDDNGSDNSRGT